MCSEEEEFIYQLRHIGPSPSCKKVPSVMSLGFGLTKIGRGQNNDYFLDSVKLKNFISRYHAEILGRKNENGEVEFVLTDKGLNGTFINDYRTQKNCPLEMGDKITFGHTNGYKIQPGFYASQPDSEFQFIFEQVAKSSRTSELSTDNFNREESTDATFDSKTFSERMLLSDKHSNIQSPQITSTKDLQRNSDSENEENKVSELDLSANSSKTDSKTEKGSSKTSHTKDKKSLDTSQDSVKSKSGKSVKDAKVKNVSALAETLPAINDEDDDNYDSGDDDKDEKDKDEKDKDEKSSEDSSSSDDDNDEKSDDDKEKSDDDDNEKSDEDDAKSDDNKIDSKKSDDNKVDDDSDEEEGEKSEEEKKNEESESSSEEEDEEEDRKPKKAVMKKTRTTRSSFTKPKPKPKAKPKGKEPKQDVMSFSEDSSDDVPFYTNYLTPPGGDSHFLCNVQKQVSSVLALINTTSESDSGQPVRIDEPPKPPPPPRGQRSRNRSGSSINTASTANKGGTSRKRNNSGQKQTAAPQKRKTTGGRGKKGAKTADKDDSDDEPAPEPKKRKTAGGRGKKDTKADDPDLSDGVEWYDEETCEAGTCKRPKGKRTAWVQCDDCDGWYHTVCVGANYRQVKDDNASFSCGCT